MSDPESLIKSHNLFPQFTTSKRSVFNLIIYSFLSGKPNIDNSLRVSKNITRFVKGSTKWEQVWITPAEQNYQVYFGPALAAAELNSHSSSMDNKTQFSLTIKLLSELSVTNWTRPRHLGWFLSNKSSAESAALIQVAKWGRSFSHRESWHYFI